MVPPAPSAPPPASPPELFRTLRWPLLGAAWAVLCLGGILVLFVYVRRRRRQRSAFETERRLSEHTAPAPQPPPPPQIQQQPDTDANTVAVARAIFDRYDVDGSGKIDSPRELDAMDCRVWRTLDQGYRAKYNGTGVAQIQGFRTSAIWVGALGITESLRERGLAAIQSCGLDR